MKLIKDKNIRIDFKSFIKIIDVPYSDINKQKINFSDFTVILLISNKSVDYYFNIANFMKFKVPTYMKYEVCLSNKVYC